MTRGMIVVANQRWVVVQNRMRWNLILGTMVLPLAMGVCVLAAASPKGDSPPPVPLPRPDHIVVVIEENHSYSQIIDSPHAPYINELAAKGALLTQSFGITHPSQPNYPRVVFRIDAGHH